MKRGTTPTIQIILETDLSLITSVDFIFKQNCTEYCKVCVKKSYPGNDVVFDGESFYVEFTEKDTRVFEADKMFYLDTRVCVGNKILETAIVPLKMNNTLFSLEDVDD